MSLVNICPWSLPSLSLTASHFHQSFRNHQALPKHVLLNSLGLNSESLSQNQSVCVYCSCSLSDFRQSNAIVTQGVSASTVFTITQQRPCFNKQKGPWILYGSKVIHNNMLVGKKNINIDSNDCLPLMYWMLVVRVSSWIYIFFLLCNLRRTLLTLSIIVLIDTMLMFTLMVCTLDQWLKESHDGYREYG